MTDVAVERYVVERYLPTERGDALADLAARLERAAADLTERGRPVSYLGSTLLSDEATCFCLFEGALEDVRACNELASAAYERITRATWVRAGVAADHADVRLLPDPPAGHPARPSQAHEEGTR